METALTDIYAGMVLYFRYKNWRGVVSFRRVVVGGIYYGVSPYHEGPQFFLRAIDTDKNEQRDFALADMSQVVKETEEKPND